MKAHAINRSLFQQARLQEFMQPGNLTFVSRVNALTAFFGGSGKGPGLALMARAEMYQELNQQATAMAYQDIYRHGAQNRFGNPEAAFAQ